MPTDTTPCPEPNWKSFWDEDLKKGVEKLRADRERLRDENLALKLENHELKRRMAEMEGAE